MGQPYIGEIRMFAGNFAPAGWAFCNGALVPISENDTLFTLIGTTYGGDGQSTFALPDLQGRLPLHMGQGNGLSNRIIGENGGTETVTLTVNQIPIHSHPLMVSTAPADSPMPTNRVYAESEMQLYSDTALGAPMNAQAIGPQGGSQPHDNMQPYLCISFIISLFGVFPSPT